MAAAEMVMGVMATVVEEMVSERGGSDLAAAASLETAVAEMAVGMTVAAVKVVVEVEVVAAGRLPPGKCRARSNYQQTRYAGSIPYCRVCQRRS